MVMWLYGWEPFKLVHHVAKFGCCRHCDSEDKTLFDLSKKQPCV